MSDRPPVQAVERRPELVEPVGVQAVLAECFVLGPQVVELLVVGQPQAAHAAKRIAGELLHPVHVSLGEAPVGLRRLRSEPLPRLRIRHRPSAQGKAAVAPARSRRDPPRLVDAHAQPSLGQREGAGAAGDAGADDGDVGARAAVRARERLGRLREPEGLSHLCRDASSPGTHPLRRLRSRPAPAP